MKKSEGLTESQNKASAGRQKALSDFKEYIMKDKNMYAYQEDVWREMLEVAEFYKMILDFTDKSEYSNHIYACIETIITVHLTCGSESIANLCEGIIEIAIKKFLDPLLEKEEKNGLS